MIGRKQTRKGKTAQTTGTHANKAAPVLERTSWHPQALSPFPTRYLLPPCSTNWRKMTQPVLARGTLRTGVSPAARQARSGTQRAEAQPTRRSSHSKFPPAPQTQVFDCQLRFSEGGAELLPPAAPLRKDEGKSQRQHGAASPGRCHRAGRPQILRGAPGAAPAPRSVGTCTASPRLLPKLPVLFLTVSGSRWL